MKFLQKIYGKPLQQVHSKAMKGLLVLFISGLLASSAWANESLTQDFKNLLARQKVGTLANQSYCYEDDEKLAGYQTRKMMPIASITKLFTTYFATELLDLHQRYTTRVFIQGDALHIAGGNDPYFEEEKMLLLLLALNHKGYSKFKTVTFDARFKFSDLALGKYQVLSTTHIRDKIALYFNPQRNLTYLKAKWKTVYKFAQEEGVELEAEMPIKMSASSVAFREQNPLAGHYEEVLVHQSRPLHSLIKAMNVMSKNLVSHYIFDEASKRKSFSTFLKERGFNTTELVIYNGSGLPQFVNNVRKDNLASCRQILALIKKLNESIRAKGFEPFELIGINGGQDNGSFRDRFLQYPETHQAVLSKTGTLAVASTLAGVLLTVKGEIPFAILNRPSSTLVARNFQDHFVSRMFHHLGEASPIPYEKISIFPWTNEEFFNL